MWCIKCALLMACSMPLFRGPFNLRLMSIWRMESAWRRLARLWTVLLVFVVIPGGLRPASADEQDQESDERFFEPIGRPAVPEVKHEELVRNAIDAFILAPLEKLGLTINTPADKLTLLRRVTFDLTGLAPTTAEQTAFLNDSSPDAYEKVVDRLLASPRYGEHMAQDWLDLVRFAETAGFKTDEERPDAFRYRDYVIQAFNNDLPYDRFVRQQIAGDELEPDNPDAVVATGYLRLYPEEWNASNFRLGRQNILDDVTEVTGLALLGVTVGCAKCHDHKFDPILQSDFYELQAFFTPMLPKNNVVLGTREERAEYDRREDEWEAATADIRRQIAELLAGTKAKAMHELTATFDPETQRACLKAESERTAVEQQLAALADRSVQRKMSRVPGYLDSEIRKKYDELAQQLASFDHLKPHPRATAMAIGEVEGPAPPTYLLAAGNYAKPLAEVGPDYPEFLAHEDPSISPPSATPTSRMPTGRRSALARWLTRRDQPLLGRVMVNRIWQHHFGRGIVGTPNDFGEMGESATHPDLLDWLAAEFIECGWSMKALHRLIVTSAVYCQSSLVDPTNSVHQQAQMRDPTNKLLWHARRLRLRGEAVRDAILQLSGHLNLRMYGKSARPELPDELMSSRYSWYPDEKVEDRNRRSVYLFARRNLRLPLLAAFDPADLISSCARRPTTVTAPQALTMLNSKLTLEQARLWAGKLLAETKHDHMAFVIEAYRSAFTRRPSGSELEEADHFLVEQSERIAASQEPLAEAMLPEPMSHELRPAQAAAMVDFCHALLNASEFMFID